MGRIRIGTSGWSYPEWRGIVYPEDLPHHDELEYITRAFDSLQVNGTFYSLTSPHACRRWGETAPPGFKYALKGSRYITHIKRLSEASQALANFFASGVLELGEHLGPILWQLPPDLEFEAERVDRFLGMLPRRTDKAVALARGHDDRVRKAAFGDGQRHRIRHVFEFRHESFLCPEMARIAQRRGTALCFSHAAEWPYMEEVTAGYVYLRLHGPDEVYASDYGRRRLQDWARRIEAWQRGTQPADAVRISSLEPPTRKSRDVYVYFDNTAAGHAPDDASALKRIIERSESDDTHRAAPA